VNGPNGAAVVARHPAHFAGLAALPLQDPDQGAAELHRAVRELGMCGALVNDHTLGQYLDEPPYQVVWAALCELGVPLYLHPGAVPADAWPLLHGHPELDGAAWIWVLAGNKQSPGGG
jgi:2,3-dihydroxybenzoate decarboxylase